MPEFNIRTEWITNGINKEAVDFCEGFAAKLVEKKLTTSQIRNFFGEVRRIQLKGVQRERSSIHLLRPKLAYNAKRKSESGNQGSEGSIIFQECLDSLMKNSRVDLTQESQFKNFVDLLEAVLAFHKAKGGK